MQEDFHYYATYCAAFLAGYNHEESLDVAYSAQFVDLCTRTLLAKIKGPSDAATTQMQLELMDARTDMVGLQDITRIWSAFHFLPKDLYATKPNCGKKYLDKYRLICGPNGDLVVKTVELAKDKPLQSVGIAMHVLADTWAHSNFAGTPSLVINNTNYVFYELFPEGDGYREVPITFVHKTSTPDDLENSIYTNSLYQTNENTIMNLGHGRAGHLPDYSFVRYKYLPAWGDYEELIKDNPSDYMKAFTQMIQAMKYIRGEYSSFQKNEYDMNAVEPYMDRIKGIIEKRQIIASEDWKAFGEDLSGQTIEDHKIDKYFDEYTNSTNKDETFIGKFTRGAMAHKGMVISEIARSNNKLAGIAR
ncbi:DUF6765 family protein [Butyrivibrio sp. AE2032]|uniref:DUF6765 family protein n=1 Tax=Butyrivibrio sp. AE2032 TaxID=1458463 RepID=UPI0005549008|nr:DUF6765 family protein [Butyrivibrio sp. AE2032]